MTKFASKELVEKYKTLISEEKEHIKQQCFDFSQLSALTKNSLDKFINYFKQTNSLPQSSDNNIIYDNFIILKSLYDLQIIKNNRKKSKRTLTKKDYAKDRSLTHNISDDDKAYTYSTKQTRELLYLCSQYYIGKGVSLLDKITISIELEKVDIYNKSVNLSNIKYIINSIPIEYICVDIAK
jgi:hypothetical protein